MKIAFCVSLLLIAAPAMAQHTKAAACAVPDQPVAVVSCAPARIYVADYDRAAIEEILRRHFDGFTILPARGCWHNTCENSLVIEIAGASEAQVRKAAEELRVRGKQEQVIVVLPSRRVPRR